VLEQLYWQFPVLALWNQLPKQKGKILHTTFFSRREQDPSHSTFHCPLDIIEAVVNKDTICRFNLKSLRSHFEHSAITLVDAFVAGEDNVFFGEESIRIELPFLTWEPELCVI